MTGDFDTVQAASTVYAQAMLDLAAKANQEDAVDGELRSLHDLYQRDQAFASFAQSPAIDRDQRRTSLRKIFGGKLSPMVLNLLLVLNDKHRLSILPQVCDTYRRLMERKRGEARVHVTSAVALTDAQRAKLSEMLSTATKWKPILCETVDANVLGGLRVLLGDREIDRTVASRLRLLRTKLLNDVDAQLYQGRTFVTEN